MLDLPVLPNQASYRFPEHLPTMTAHFRDSADQSFAVRVTYLAEAFLTALGLSSEEISPGLVQGYGIEGLRDPSHWRDNYFTAYP